MPIESHIHDVDENFRCACGFVWEYQERPQWRWRCMRCQKTWEFEKEEAWKQFVEWHNHHDNERLFSKEHPHFLYCTDCQNSWYFPNEDAQDRFKQEHTAYHAGDRVSGATG